MTHRGGSRRPVPRQTNPPPQAPRTQASSHGNVRPQPPRPPRAPQPVRAPPVAPVIPEAVRQRMETVVLIPSHIRSHLHQDFVRLNSIPMDMLLRADLHPMNTRVVQIQPVFRPPEVFPSYPKKPHEEGGTCAICIEAICEPVCVLPHCVHAYHPACLETWWSKGKRTCPECRSSLCSQL